MRLPHPLQFSKDGILSGLRLMGFFPSADNQIGKDKIKGSRD
jgi:hypothetical protein